MSADTAKTATLKPQPEKLATFHIGPDLFGVDVSGVQEVTGNLAVIGVPLAPEFVRGLVNLRGQIATALGLRELFGAKSPSPADKMSLICKVDGNLISLLVDSIGDIVEVKDTPSERPPDNISPELGRFIKGIYKMNGTLLSLIDLDLLAKELSPRTESNI